MLVWWRRCALAAAMLTCVAAPSLAQIPPGALRDLLGANKPDLLMQYLGTASNAGGSDAAREVTIAMARKAIADAKDAGIGFFRIMGAGYGPVAPPPVGAPSQNDLALWQSDAALYWSRLDQMFDDLDDAGLRLVPSFVWNPLQFPALTGESTADLIANPDSRSRALLFRYLGEFIHRYSARPTILFYEFGNELNLDADLDIHGRCLAVSPADACTPYGNYTSAQLTVFARAVAQRIRALDPTRPISSGYSLPRASAWHLAAQPEFSPNGPDWTADSLAQFRSVLIGMDKPFDLWSVHIYPGDVRWGNPAGSESRTLAAAANTARAHGRRLYLGEFGDSTLSPYLRSMLRGLAGGATSYASAWVWEFYQTATWLSSDLTSAPPESLEPGFTDAIDGALAEAAGGYGPLQVAQVRVVLTAPLPCAVLTGPTELYATASTSRGTGVKRVVFAVDGVAVGVARAVPYHVTYTPTVPGLHRITATAYDGTLAAQMRVTVLVGPTKAQCAVP